MSFGRSVYEQHHLRSSINFAMYKIKLGKVTTGTVKSNFKRTIERLFASDNAFSFMSSAKGASAYWKQFLYDVLTMVNKQLGIPTYFLTLSCTDLRWEELLYIFLTNKMKFSRIKKKKLN